MYLVRFLFFSLLFPIHAYCADYQILYDAIDRGDVSEITDYFNNLGEISFEQAEILLLEIQEHYSTQYGLELLNSEEYQDSLFQYKELYYSLLEQHDVHLGDGYRTSSNFARPMVYFCSINNDWAWRECIPGSLPIGGAEIFAGALVWILPIPGARQLGGFLIGDGIRRTLNGLEEIDDERRKLLSQPSEKISYVDRALIV